ncbi:TPM domain-containing protein, partial [Thermodesulfobacteriota bacterium]
MSHTISKPAATIIATIALLISLGVTARAFQEVPTLKGRINDYAGLLTPRQTSSLEQTLALHERKTTNQIILLTIPSLEGEDLEGFSIRVAEAWKPGVKGKDNGVILVVARDDGRARIEVGYGLEGALTDAQSSQIMRNGIIPHFKAGDYYSGIAVGLGTIVQAIEGEFQAAPGRSPVGGRRAAGPKSLAQMLFFLFFIIITFVLRMGSFGMLGGRRRHRRSMLMGALMFGGLGRGGGGGF